jgi:hypothetical protein
MRRGDTVDVLLVDQNKNKKWRAQTLEFEAFGVIDGAAPAEAEAGQRHRVEIVSGGDPKNLNLKWVQFFSDHGPRCTGTA